MAEERDDTEHTEDPTPRRLEEAIKRGDVVKSAEVADLVHHRRRHADHDGVRGADGGSLEVTFRGLLVHSGQIPTDGPALAESGAALATRVLAALGIPLLLLALAALIGNAIQHRVLFSVEPIMPDLSRISPAAGLKRLFSGRRSSISPRGSPSSLCSARSSPLCCGRSATGCSA